MLLKLKKENQIKLKSNQFCLMCSARHLADCKRKSAYPSPERAVQCTLQGQSASCPPLVTLDEEDDAQDNEEKWLRAFAQPRTSSGDTPEKSCKSNFA